MKNPPPPNFFGDEGHPTTTTTVLRHPAYRQPCCVVINSIQTPANTMRFNASCNMSTLSKEPSLVQSDANDRDPPGSTCVPPWQLISPALTELTLRATYCDIYNTRARICQTLLDKIRSRAISTATCFYLCLILCHQGRGIVTHPISSTAALNKSFCAISTSSLKLYSTKCELFV